ncbi:hypothetical protein DFO66_1123 [Brevibacterium sanguinis]|uniref:Spermatogenesis-associated protein 20-like TRX domain-containing protein n=2 Tax=Brevibacterium TaxID=1696 RepID=A0A366IGD9_9MICO|nr:MULTISPECIES: DUF255 domain-containing protein [Brevibacterium]RBP62899.1 hypothetical protein DFO66_1123 [Brevibacterium sanguinis]RBP69556.1 hypothetical protein DFO65_11290 [Brevibacterium celere]
MANELASSTSPYLRAHADNPVDWRMWTKENLAEAARRDVPLLISIGYSTCHWCHVMAHESFEDEAVARIVNERFLPIKIDREELPDIDSYYMNALQAMRGQGGWPMTIFATPGGSPFYAGTYFPPAPRGNLPSFTQVLTAVSETWADRRAEVDEMTRRMDRGLAEMATAVTKALPAEATRESLRADELDEAAATLLDSYDPAWGGFGGAPKFPPLMNLLQLMATFERLRRGAEAVESGVPTPEVAGSGTSASESGTSTSELETSTRETSGSDRVREALAPDGSDRVREALAPDAVDRLGADGHLTGELALDCLIAVRNTFARIASGGMRDQVRGGIARYSVDRQWFVPHFEKMLYDNALYLRAAVQWTKVERSLNPDSKWTALAEREVEDTAYFLIADMTAGGDRFIAALDADSLNAEGVLEEGAAYAVRPEEFPANAGGVLGLVNSPAGAELSGAVVAATGIIDWLRDDKAPLDADHPAPWDTPATIAQRSSLKELLDERPAPARDEKTITEWNSLATTALAEAALYVGGLAGGAAFRRGVDTDSDTTTRAVAWAAAAATVWETAYTAFKRDGLQRSSTDGVPGPGLPGLADWAQFLTAGITVRQLQEVGLIEGRLFVDEDAFDGQELGRLAAEVVATFTSGLAGTSAGVAGAAAAGTGAEESSDSFEVFDSQGDEILAVRTADPVDNALPSGRAAAAEAMLLLGELGSDGPLTTSQVLQIRDRLLGVYRALAGRAPRGCGHALWQAERALAPVRVATRDADLLAVAARHPAVTLLVSSTGVRDEHGDEVAVPDGAAIVCRGTECSLPVTTTEELAKLLDS